MPTISELKEKHRKEGKFECDGCHGLFDLNEDFDPTKEAEELWGEDSKRDDQIVYCDICFNDLMTRLSGGFANEIPS